MYRPCTSTENKKQTNKKIMMDLSETEDASNRQLEPDAKSLGQIQTVVASKNPSTFFSTDLCSSWRKQRKRHYSYCVYFFVVTFESVGKSDQTKIKPKHALNKREEMLSSWAVANCII